MEDIKELTKGTEVELNQDLIPPGVEDRIHVRGIITEITENYYQVVWKGLDKKTWFLKEFIKPIKKEEEKKDV